MNQLVVVVSRSVLTCRRASGGAKRRRLDCSDV